MATPIVTRFRAGLVVAWCLLAQIIAEPASATSVQYGATLTAIDANSSLGISAGDEFTYTFTYDASGAIGQSSGPGQEGYRGVISNAALTSANPALSLFSALPEFLVADENFFGYSGYSIANALNLNGTTVGSLYLNFAYDTNSTLVPSVLPSFSQLSAAELGNTFLVANWMSFASTDFSYVVRFSLQSLTTLVTDGDGDAVPDGTDNCPTVSNPDQADTNDDGVGDLCDDLTPEGSGIAISPAVTLPDGTSTTTVELTFDTVTTAGSTTVTTASNPSDGTPGSPTGFKIGNPPVYYDVSTTAEFSGSVVLCFSWQEGQFNNENNIKLFHFESGAWLDVTTALNTTENKVCGEVSSLSPFALFESSFAGFFAPVDNPPIQNTVKAGAAVPVKFSLGGDYGLSIFASGYPVSQSVACESGAPSDAIDETVTAGS
ncbi:MAG TPA: PxKF domain-containing protein, partial [Opitutaceae bacterium]|nr:PxKF domain-containing protein [Opitutaceae bacterium]